jgi:glycosyltransferase involved in cell wall biosynthesis
MVALTIGMPTYNDFDGVYFTLQALRLYQDLDDTELLVVDNYGCKHTRDFVEGWAKARYVLETDAVGTAAAKNRVFAEAQGEAVLCCDSHVLLAPGSIARLKDYYRAHPDSIDLLQGPLVYDDLQTISTHLDPVWRGQMWGIWGTDSRALDPEADPFEIWGQGMGVFSCRKEAWPGFHPAFRGFGGEEGYIHEKVRQHGGRCLCLPWLRWGHRFGRPAGIPYTVSVEDKFRNYFIGYIDLGLNVAPVLDHFAEHLPAETIVAVAEQVLRDQKVKKPKKGKKEKKRQKNGKGGNGEEASAGITLAILAQPHDSKLGQMPDVRIGVFAPTHDRPGFARTLAMQMAMQVKKPDVLCFHQNGDPESYQWAIADLPLPFTARWIHTPESIPQDEWYSHPLEVLLDDGCTHFFWCDDDDIYRSDHLDRSMMMLTDKEDPCDFVVNGYSGMLFMRKAGYEYLPCQRFSAHAPGGMSSSMAFNRAFAEELFQDLIHNQGQLYFADQVVANVTMPKFRCKLDERQSPSTIYLCHPGADSSKHWLGEE